MNPQMIRAILAGLSLIKVIADDIALAKKGELDPEQLALEWEGTARSYTAASDGWRNARSSTTS